MKNLMAKNSVGKEVMVCSDIENDSDRKIFGDMYLSDEDENFCIDELGEKFELFIEEE